MLRKVLFLWPMGIFDLMILALVAKSLCLEHTASWPGVAEPLPQTVNQPEVRH